MALQVSPNALALDEREIKKVDDSGGVSVSFDVITVGGNEVNSVPVWLSFDWSKRQEQDGSTTVLPVAEVDVRRAVVEKSVETFVWTATVSDGSAGEFRTILNDTRKPTRAVELFYYKKSEGALYVKALGAEIGPTKVTTIEEQGYDYFARVKVDQITNYLLIQENDGNTQAVKARNARGEVQNGFYWGGDSARAYSHDRFRSYLLHNDTYSGGQFRSSNLLGGALIREFGRFRSGWIYDLALDLDSRRLFFGGQQLGDADSDTLAKAEYFSPTIEYESIDAGEVQAVEVDQFKEVVFTVEEGGRYLRQRDQKDLSVVAEHDFGNSTNVYGIDVDEGQQEVFFSKEGSGIKSIPYAMDEPPTEVIGTSSARHPALVKDGLPPLPPSPDFQITKEQALDLRTTVSVGSVSGFETYQLEKGVAADASTIRVDGKPATEGRQVTLVDDTLQRFSKRYYRVTFIGSDGEQNYATDKKFVFAGRLRAFTRDELWDDRSVNYQALSPATNASSRVIITAEEGDNGVIMEAGAQGDGMAVWSDGASLYFACGRGDSTGSSGRVAWLKTELPTNEDDVIEWSASADLDHALLFVNGELRDIGYFTESSVSGGNDGGIGRGHAGLRSVTGGDDVDFAGKIRRADIYSGETLGPIPEVSLEHVTRNEVAVDVTSKIDGQPSRYVLYRSDAKDGTYQKIDEVSNPSETVQFTDDSEAIQIGETKFYKATVDIGGSEGLFSKTVEAEVDLQQPSLSLVGTTSDSATLEASVIGKAPALYRFLRSGSQGGPYQEVGSVSDPNATQDFTDQPVDTNETHYYKVEFETKNGDVSPRSDAVQV